MSLTVHVLALAAIVLETVAPPASGLEKTRIELPTGVTVAYLEIGSPEGEPVLFLHGYTDSTKTFEPTMERLASLRPDLRLIAVDQRGHGEATLPHPDACRPAPGSCFEPEDFAADAFALMDALGLERVHVVGHSMGSIVAQEMALARPERIERIVLIGTSSDLTANAGVEEFLLDGLIEGPWKEAIERRGLRFPDDAYEMTPVDVDPGAEAWIAENWVVDPTAAPDYLAEIVPRTSRTPIGTWLGAVRALREVDNTKRLESLSVPALVIWPVQDSFFPESPDQAGLRAALDVAASKCITHYFWKAYGREPLPASGLQENDLGHNVQWGAPAEVAADLAAFLREGGEPTRDLYYADPTNPRRILTEPGKARTIASPRGSCRP